MALFNVWNRKNNWHREVMLEKCKLLKYPEFFHIDPKKIRVQNINQFTGYVKLKLISRED